ncbi:MAG: MBL fold metallo-hydrolase [Candidatus Thermoplasmatota archaeon]|nr:MBL fold metallo-hydrolase [Candidatus Thermoplasmatota archaeon]
MVEQFLPPPPRMETWSGRVFRAAVRYSCAGISTSIFLEHREGTIVLDCGDGAIRDMIEILRAGFVEKDEEPIFDLEVSGNRIDALLITHGHFDHYSGILAMLEFLHLLGRTRPLPIIYPVGAASVEGIVDHFVEHLWETPGFDVDLVPVVPGDRLDISGTGVDVFKAFHRNSKPGVTGCPLDALSFRLTRDGETVAYSGDTSDVEALEPVVKDADLAIIEATFPDGFEGAEGVHLTLDQAKEAGKAARAVMLIHFTAASFREMVGNTKINPATREG